MRGQGEGEGGGPMSQQVAGPGSMVGEENQLTGTWPREQGLGVGRGGNGWWLGCDQGRRTGGRRGGGGNRATDPEAGARCKCRSWCEDGRARGSRLQARPSVGTGRPGRTGRPSRRARNGAEARTCRAMPRHSVVQRSRIAFSMKIFLETAPVEAANSASSWRSANAGGRARQTCVTSTLAYPWVAHECLRMHAGPPP